MNGHDYTLRNTNSLILTNPNISSLSCITKIPPSMIQWDVPPPTPSYDRDYWIIFILLLLVTWFVVRAHAWKQACRAVQELADVREKHINKLQEILNRVLGL